MTAPRKALTIAGSDTSGGAGMPADLKTFEELGVYGMVALTCIVTESPEDWAVSIHPIGLDTVERQLATILDGIGVNAMKTGMLGSTELVELVARTIDRYRLKNVVIDPVLIGKGGASVLVPEAAAAIRELLVSRCTIITPNAVEAAYLADLPEVKTLDDVKESAARIVELGASAVVVKGGGRIEGNGAVDVFYDGKTFTELRGKKLVGAYSHGAGCTFSAAITAGLANGLALLDAVKVAKKFVTAALKYSFALNRFTGYTDHTAFRKHGEG